jgi:hypothetical protein
MGFARISTTGLLIIALIALSALMTTTSTPRAASDPTPTPTSGVVRRTTGEIMSQTPQRSPVPRGAQPTPGRLPPRQLPTAGPPSVQPTSTQVITVVAGVVVAVVLIQIFRAATR